MDIQMPIMDGFEATERIREFEKANKVSDPCYIIALTANAQTKNHERAIECGMNDFLAKPINFQEITASLERAREFLDLQTSIRN